MPGTRTSGQDRNQDTLLRQIMLLQWIPRAPRRISAPELHQRLAARNFTSTLRTVQRDLDRLSLVLPLVCDESRRPFGWMWARDAPELSLPALDPATALAYAMVEDYLRPLFPASLLGRLRPRFQLARQNLAAHTAGGIGHWPERIRMLHRGLNLTPPEVEREILYAVSEALLAGKCILGSYRARSTGEIKRYLVNPLALVMHGGILYLLATLRDYDDIRHLALHRFVSARPHERDGWMPEDFDLDEYIDRGGFDYPVGSSIRFAARVHPDLAFHLEECPMSPDQELAAGRDGWCRLRATVADTRQLRWWLLGLGDRVRVDAPAGLRREIRTGLESARALYD